MTRTWLAGAKVHDLHPAIGNGPFSNFLGVALHVNVDENGTPDSFWGNGNPGQVCPNFQVMKDGSIHQMLPLDWQPWCQINGNFNYAAIETAGMPDEPLTDAQLASCAAIVRAYHEDLGMPLVVTDTPGKPGLITHQAGGAAWGGHSCPGTVRAAQRSKIIALAKPAAPAPTDLLEWIMTLPGAPKGLTYKQFLADQAQAVFDHLLKNELGRDAKFSSFVASDHGRLIALQADVDKLASAP
jgi:hypothetical protein